MSRFDYADGRRRPPQDTRALLNGVLWILRTSVQWRELPPKYLPYQTCHRRFSVMAPDGLLRDVLPRPGPCRSGETKDIRVAHYQASLVVVSHGIHRKYVADGTR